MEPGDDLKHALDRLSRAIGEGRSRGEDVSALIGEHRRLSEELREKAGAGRSAERPRDSAVRVIRSAEEFRLLAEPWNDLLERADAYSPFVTWEWMYSWYEQSGGQHPLFIVAVERGDDLLALAPMILAEGSEYMPGRQLCMVGTGNRAQSDILDLLLAREEPEGEWREKLWSFLLEEQDVADAIVLQHVDLGSDAVQGLTRAALARGWVVLQASSGTRACGRLPGTWEEFVAQVPDPERRRFLRRLDAELGSTSPPTRLEWCERLADAAAYVEPLARLSVERFGARSAWADPAFRRVMDAAIRGMWPRGWVSLEAMRAGEHTVGARMAFRFRGTSLGYQYSAAKSWPVRSPGHAMVALSIRRSIADGLARFDFLAGSQSYKREYFRDGGLHPVVTLVLIRYRGRPLRCMGSRLWVKGLRSSARRALQRLRAGSRDRGESG